MEKFSNYFPGVIQTGKDLYTPVIAAPSGDVVWSDTAVPSQGSALDRARFEHSKKYGVPGYGELLNTIVALVKAIERAGNLMAITNSDAMKGAKELKYRSEIHGIGETA